MNMESMKTRSEARNSPFHMGAPWMHHRIIHPSSFPQEQHNHNLERRRERKRPVGSWMKWREPPTLAAPEITATPFTVPIRSRPFSFIFFSDPWNCFYSSTMWMDSPSLYLIFLFIFHLLSVYKKFYKKKIENVNINLNIKLWLNP